MIIRQACCRASSEDRSKPNVVDLSKNFLSIKVFHELDWVEDLGSGTRNILKYAPLYYPDYRIGISNGQQFVFAITYADAEDENVGRNQEMSVETTKCR